MEEKYVLIQDYNSKYGTLKEGGEIIIFRGVVYYNGGMVNPAYASILITLIDNEELRKKYLRKEKIIPNKV